jgi:hypothetical protein
VITVNPLAITEHNTHTSGTKAMSIDNVISTVATSFATRRRPPSPEIVRALTGRSQIEVTSGLS